MNPINLGPRDLEAVLAVAECGSFRAAAAAIGLSQPSVSARVRHAENVLGVKLFHRTTRKVAITAHGERLCVRAEQAMADLRALAQEFRDESRLKRGRVVIGATPSLAAALLPELLHRFRERWPGIEVILRDDFLGRAFDRVHMGDVDFAVTPSAEDDARFECEPLKVEESLLVAPAGHPLVRKSTLRLGAAEKFPLLTMPSGTATREMLRRAYAAAGLSFHPAFETHNMMSVLAMVKAGFGFCFIPADLIPLFNMSGLRTARVVDANMSRTVTITRAKGRALQPAAQALIDTLKEAFRDE